MNTRKTPIVIASSFIALATLMSGCASTETRTVTPVSSSSSSNYRTVYGVIESIEITRASGDSGIGAGAVIGGIVGGVLGNQVGGGTGQDVATVAGVAGGAMVGHQIQKSNKQQEAFLIRVRLDNGGYQTVAQQSMVDLRVGDQVRIENERVSRY